MSGAVAIEGVWRLDEITWLGWELSLLGGGESRNEGLEVDDGVGVSGHWCWWWWWCDAGIRTGSGAAVVEVKCGLLGRRNSYPWSEIRAYRIVVMIVVA